MFPRLRPLFERLQTPQTLLQLGLALRVLIYWFLSPENNDRHIDIVRFIVENGRLPLTKEVSQAHHPPLYYLLAAPLMAWSGNLKVVQLLSLVCSIATLIVLYRMIYHDGLIENPQARKYSFLFACFLPQFVMFSLYISNDSLSFLLGALAAWQTFRYIRSPDWKQLVLLAVIAGLGLLTKVTLLAFIPPLFVLVWFLSIHPMSVGRAISRATAFLAIALALGSYKSVENYIYYRDPFISNMDVSGGWPARQKLSYRGVQSYLDVNLAHLVMSPTVSGATAGSYPLLFYGSFWYQHFPESNFRGNLHRPLSYLGSLIYVVALVPSVVFMLGLAILCKEFGPFIARFDRHRPEDLRSLSRYVAVLFLLSIAVLVLLTLFKYHIYSIMQGRYLFAAIFGGLAVFAAGFEAVSRSRFGMSLFKVGINSLFGLFFLYFASEVSLIFFQRNLAARSFVLSLIHRL